MQSVTECTEQPFSSYHRPRAAWPPGRQHTVLHPTCRCCVCCAGKDYIMELHIVNFVNNKTLPSAWLTCIGADLQTGCIPATVSTGHDPACVPAVPPIQPLELTQGMCWPCAGNSYSAGCGASGCATVVAVMFELADDNEQEDDQTQTFLDAVWSIMPSNEGVSCVPDSCPCCSCMSACRCAEAGNGMWLPLSLRSSHAL